MADKIVFFSVYDPICEVLRGGKYTSRDEAEIALEWWKVKVKADTETTDFRWEHLELAIVTIERLPSRVSNPEAPAPTDPEPFQTE